METDRKLKNKFNVLLITIDSLRADFLGCYNKEISKEGISPNIDKWASNAIFFLDANTQSSHTSASFLSMLSGKYPSNALCNDWYSFVSEKRTMISQIFKSNGYYTCAFHSNPYISNYYGFNKGFDLFMDNLPQLSQGKIKGKFLNTFYRLKNIITEPYENAEKINSQVFTWLRKKVTPHFLWVHYMDVHGPYISKDGWTTKNRLSAFMLWRKALSNPEKITEKERKTLLETYKEEIRYLDHQIAKLLEIIDNDNTIIILTADHGDLLGEHKLYGHTEKLYNSALHVPLLIKLPKFFKCNTHNIKSPVKHIDLAPTLVDILGLKSENSFDGASFWSLMVGKDTKYDSDYIISEITRKYLCVRKNEWKLIVNYKKNYKELYNLSHDSEEKNNLISQHKEKADELESIIKKHLANAKRVDISPKIVVEDEEIKARLEALGYMDKE